MSQKKLVWMSPPAASKQHQQPPTPTATAQQNSVVVVVSPEQRRLLQEHTNSVQSFDSVTSPNTNDSAVFDGIVQTPNNRSSGLIKNQARQ